LREILQADLLELRRQIARRIDQRFDDWIAQRLSQSQQPPADAPGRATGDRRNLPQAEVPEVGEFNEESIVRSQRLAGSPNEKLVAAGLAG
jgi:hypothetical protein